MAKAKTPAREFELLVESFEKACGPDVAVKSPDRIRDIHTGQMREIDISLRFPATADSPAKVIIVECRKRGRKADVCWIEQVAQKVLSVAANGAILVAEGFSSPAAIKAKCLGLQARTVGESRDPGKMLELFHSTYVGMVTLFPRWEIVEWIPVSAEGALPSEPMSLSLAPNDKIYRVEPDGLMLSMLEVFERSIQPMQSRLFQEWKVGAEKQRRGCTIRMPEGASIALVTISGELALSEVWVGLDVWYEETQASPDKAYSYDGENGLIVKAVEHNSSLAGHNVRLRFIHAQDTGLVTISSEPVSEDSGPCNPG